MAGRACKARWDFHDHRGRPQGTARRVWLIGRILNTPARLWPHNLRPVVESQSPSRQGRPPHKTDQNLPEAPTMARRKVGVSSVHEPVFQSACESALSKTSPGRSKGPADPVRSALPSMSTRATRDCFQEPHRQILTLAAGSWQQPILLCESIPWTALTDHTAAQPVACSL